MPIAINVPLLEGGVSGTLPGQLAVTNRGSAAYRIPISVPPGTAGMRPVLSLDYDSDNTTGSAGLGWSLGGLSNIDRCGKVLAIDGVTKAVQFTNADRLCLDGQRLIREDGANDDASYWADNAIYRTEVESFTRVRAEGYGIANRSFKAELKDGTLRWFGNDPTSYSVMRDLREGALATHLAHRWRLDRAEDRSGNYIHYAYKAFANGENKPAVISWGGHGTAAYAKVIFGYQARADARHAYIHGSPIFEAQILETITTWTSTDAGIPVQVLTYTLTHRTSGTSGRNLLSQVQVCTPDHSCLPATKFQWGERDANVPKAFVPLGTTRNGPNLEALGGANAAENRFGPGYEGPMDMVLAGDFNGDGRTDFLERKRVAANNYKQRLFTSTADGTGWTVSTPVPGGPGTSEIMNVGDFNGDGKLDLLTAYVYLGYPPTNWHVCLYEKDAYVCQPVNLPPDAFRSQNQSVRAVRDFDADGRDDVYLSAGQQTEVGPTPARYYCVQFTSASGFVCQTHALDVLNQDATEAYTSVGHDSADVDGDGHVDDIELNRCVWRKQPDLGRYSWDCGNDAGVEVFDRYDPDGTYLGGGWYELSAPIGVYPPPPKPPAGVIPPVTSGTLSADITADGYTDLIIGTASLNQSPESLGTTHQSNLCTSHGDGNADCVVLPAIGNNLDHLIMTVQDFDGDGVSDVLRPSIDTWRIDSFDSYLLCRVENGGSAQTCENWTGPTYYSHNRYDAFIGRSYRENDWTKMRSGFYGDFDGDGIADIATYLRNGQWQIYKAAPQAKAGQVLDKLVSVTNGVGRLESVQFASPSDPNVYLGDGTGIDGTPLLSGYPIKRIANKRPLVARLEYSNGASGSTVTEYQYSGYAVDAQGRGNLGFARQIVRDLTTNTTTSTWFSQQFPSVGMMTDRLVVHGNVELERTRNILKSFDRVSKPGAVAETIPYIDSSVTARKDLNARDLGTTTTTYTYDAWLNPSVVTEKSELSPLAFLSTTTTTFNNDPENWLLGQPLRVQVTKTTDQGTITHTTDYGYDPKTGLLTSEIREAGNQALEVKTTYDRSAGNAAGNPFGLVNSTKIDWLDPVTAKKKTRVVSRVTYDPYGRYSRRMLNALSQPQSTTFDPRSGAATSVTAVNGLTTTFTVDGFGRTESELGPDGVETSKLERQCDGICPPGATRATIRRTLFNGALTAAPVITYKDSAGHVLRTLTWGFDGTEIVADVRYDDAGRQWEVDQPRFKGAGSMLAKRITYDDLGRPTTVEQPDEHGNMHAWTTDYDGWTTTFTQPAPAGAGSASLSRIETRDMWGRLSTAVDTMGNATVYNHDAFGNLTKTTDPKGNVVQVSYDLLGRRTDLHDPDLGWVHYDVDPLGQVYQQVTPEERKRHDVTSFIFDELGRTVSRREPDLVSNWIFDNGSDCSPATRHSCGQLVEANTMAGGSKDYVRTLDYDGAGRLRTTTLALDSLYTSTSEYDNWGRLLRQRYQREGGVEKVFDYRYNGYGYLARIERGKVALWTATAQDASQRVTAALLGNGTSVSRDYNPYNGLISNAVLTDSAQRPLLIESYHYDPLQNLEQRGVSWDNAGFTESFGYDNLNRLRTSTIGDTVSTFTYNEIGNIVSKTGVGTGNYVYPANGEPLPHAVMGIPGIGSFSYDDDGNMTSGAGHTARWTSFDMLDMIGKGDDWSIFIYGPEHQRIRQDKADGSRIYYAGAMQVEFASNGASKVKTYWPAGLGLETEDASGTHLLWTHEDRQGSVIAITGEDGAVKERMIYDSWGKRRELDNALTPDSIDGVTDNKGYTGHEMLDNVDLVHMNGRVYDPFIGRFISADPIIQEPEHSQSYNRYTYVWNNPTNLTDPTGFLANSAEKQKKEEGIPVVTIVTSCPKGAICISDSKGRLYQYLGFIRPNENSPKRGTDGTASQGRNDASANSGNPNQPEKNYGDHWTEYKREIPFSGADGPATNAFVYDDWALGKGYMTQEQWNARARARFTGGAIGFGIFVGGAVVAEATEAFSVTTTTAAEMAVPRVLANRAVGNAFRDEIADGFRKLGYEVTTEVYKKTIFGARYIDIEVAKAGVVLGGIETKYGNAVYSAAQRAKDFWLGVQGYVVNIVRSK